MSTTVRIFVRAVLTLGLAAVLVATGVVVLGHQATRTFSASSDEGPVELINLNALSQRSVVLDRHGQVLAILHAEENRSPLPLGAIPDHVVNAVLDVEDAAFYSHRGVNVRAVARAALTNVREGELLQGGSTITQQLVKNVLLTPERDVERKIKEAVLAVRLEQQYSKDEILEHYLNTVYFGAGAYGVQAAAETYFGTDAAGLDPGQAAFLAGIIRNPVGYDPTLGEAQAEAARRRRDFALDRMVERGHLEPNEAIWFKAHPVPQTRVQTPFDDDDFFIEEVKQQLLDDPRLGETPQDRYNAVFRGGLKIRTTLDPRMQAAATAAVTNGIPASWKGKFTGALISVDPRNGAVRAMVAGEDFKAEQTNLATGRGGTGRQAGSSFKPFVLASAFENGYGPDDTVNGTMPCRTVREGRVEKVYDPGNYEGSRGAVTSLVKATASSMNCAFIRLGLAVGLDKVADTAKRAGITSRLELPEGGYADSMPLGSREVTPLEMASAYGTFANDGVHHEPTFVEEVVDANGRVVFRNDEPGERRIEPQVARLLNQALQSVVTSGTGTRARLPNRWVAGKTGTSNNSENIWFVGYTPQLSTAVWMGSPAGNVSMGRATGGTYAAPIWKAFMTEALKDEAPVGFPPPDPKLIPKRKTVQESITQGGKSSTTAKATKRSTTRRPTATTARRATATTATPTTEKRAEPAQPGDGSSGGDKQTDKPGGGGGDSGGSSGGGGGDAGAGDAGAATAGDSG